MYYRRALFWRSGLLKLFLDGTQNFNEEHTVTSSLHLESYQWGSSWACTFIAWYSVSEFCRFVGSNQSTRMRDMECERVESRTPATRSVPHSMQRGWGKIWHWCVASRLLQRLLSPSSYLGDTHVGMRSFLETNFAIGIVVASAVWEYQILHGECNVAWCGPRESDSKIFLEILNGRRNMFFLSEDQDASWGKIA